MATFDIILTLLTIAVFITVIFHHFKLPAIVGYIIVGILTGPHALAWVADRADIHEVAEFGIVFLLFTIGLEFSPARLKNMRMTVLAYGGLQVLLSLLGTLLFGLLVKMTFVESLLIGFVVALSSTAIVSKQLTEQQEILSQHGRAAIGILLFQDIAVVPILILIPALVLSNGNDISWQLSWAFIKGIAAIGFIYTAGRWVLRPMFHHIAQTRSVELFTLTVLLITLGSAWLTHKLGLSLALGAFIAGMMLGETEFRQQIEHDIRPFRDVLLGLFFISIGMQLDTRLIFSAWEWLLLLLVAILLFKTALVTVLGLLFKYNKQKSLQIGLILAQGGEFGFAILALALNYQLIPQDYAQVVLGTVLMTMVIAPFMIRYNKQIAESMLRLVFTSRAATK